MKDGASVANLDKHKPKGTHWIASCTNANSVAYFDKFGAELIPEKIKSFIGNENIITRIIQSTSF